MRTSNKIVIVGAGITGITLAQRFASAQKQCLVIEKRGHVGGNCYDLENDAGILVQKYGPHIFHTDDRLVWDYLSQFTDWIDYQHEVLGFIDNKYVPIPFNLNTLEELLPPEDAGRLGNKLTSSFDIGETVPILKLKNTKDKDLGFLADLVYEKVFIGYTKKQWALAPEEIDPEVTARVPVVISRDNRYFHDKHQGIPIHGYSRMFEAMLEDKNIEVFLNTDFKDIKDDLECESIFYTGPIDEFFDYNCGKLDYRCLRIDFETLAQREYQPAAVVNYPNSQDFTRITEFKKLTQQKNEKTTIGKEYPGSEGYPAWPVLNDKNLDVFEKYKEQAEKLKEQGVYFIGRLAEFKYYDMDTATKRAMDTFSSFKEKL
jgi:UDP-galactopyranose mutase